MKRFLILAVLLGLLGCGDSGPKRAAVSGTVRVNGQLLERGVITFAPVEGTVGPGAGGPITNGEFDLDQRTGPVVGANKVEIRGWRKTGKKYYDSMLRKEIDIETMIVPPEYNDKSTEVRTIQPGENELNFDLPGLPAGSSKTP